MSPEGFISICKQEHVTIFAKSTNSGKHKNFIISNNKNVYDFYSGKGKWSSTPIVFSSLDNALRSLPRATGVLLAKDFISAGIVAQNKTKQGEYTVYYGVTFKKDAGVFTSGYKCNHVRWKPASSKVKVYAEDDTIIGIINFAESSEEDDE